MTTDRTRYLQGLVERLAELHYKFNKMAIGGDLEEDYIMKIEDLKLEIIKTVNKYECNKHF